MTGHELQSFVSLLGIILQFAGALLFATFFRVLRPYARRRRYFRTWGWAWTALTVAAAMLGLRYLLEPPTGVLSGTTEYLFQAGKGIHFLLLALGTAQYVGTSFHPRAPLLVVPVALVYALACSFLAPGLTAVLVWQAPLAVAALGWSAVRLAALPRSRHGLGSQITVGVLALMATLWLLYFLAFIVAVDGTLLRGPLVFELVVRFKHYIDLLMVMLLGFGMIIVLMEHAKREADDANAELGVAHSHLRRAALYDTMTGSLNRRAFAENVGIEGARATFGAVMMFDLDDLKLINDTYGHSAGDALLCHLTAALRAELRPTDRLYRWGGDEFLVILQGANEAGANARIRDILSRAAPLFLGPDQAEVPLNVSMGSAAYASAEELQAAIDTADARMYVEKNEKKQQSMNPTTVSEH